MKTEAAIWSVLAVALTGVGACAGAAPAREDQDPPVMAPAQAVQGQGVRTGFLTAATLPDAVAVIPAAPREGDTRNELDWKIFRDLRSLEGTERWRLAQRDNSYAPADLVKDFSCAVGVELTADTAPSLATILARTTIDAGAAAEKAKQLYKRTRPYLHNPGNICIERSEALSKSFDYPSGHASLGWTAALVVAQLVPDRAGDILARGRAYGESRAVCGVHNMSAVEAGRTNAAGVFAALQSSKDFQAQMARAREEIETVRSAGKRPDPALCLVEKELVKPIAVF